MEIDTTNVATEKLSIGTVRFFNARPLIYGLDQLESVILQPEVPAKLADLLDNGQIDAALVPSIDYQRSPVPWYILPVAAIGSAGKVLTVRIFSNCQPDKINRLICDNDSHTSVALAEIIWQKRYRRVVEIVRPGKNEVSAMTDLPAETGVLLIGDKVLGQLGRWRHELDLGSAWDELTGLPFVYAFWAIRADDSLKTDSLVKLLRGAYRAGLENLDEIVEQYRRQHGFGQNIARKYLTENICFEFNEKQQQGLRKFYELAYQIGVITKIKEQGLGFSV